MKARRMSNPTTLQVYVKGTPRPRPGLAPGRKVYKRTGPAADYGKIVQAACRAVRAQCGQVNGPVRLDLELWFAVGKRKERIGQWHDHTPDWDNVLKHWQDAAQKAGLIENDCKVSVGKAKKLWSGQAGALLTITALKDGPVASQDDDDDLGVLTDPPARG